MTGFEPAQKLWKSLMLTIEHHIPALNSPLFVLNCFVPALRVELNPHVLQTYVQTNYTMGAYLLEAYP